MKPLLLWNSGIWTGVENMAWDEALLEWCRERSEPRLIGRTYEWAVPTLSLGVNQPLIDIETILKAENKTKINDTDNNPLPKAWVKRPTGGRAIQHGEDISLSWITNDPQLIQLPLRQSYQFLNHLLSQALVLAGVPLAGADKTKNKTQSLPDSHYTRSAWCFKTHTPMDLLTPEGRKIVGAAQLRRHGGLLQHGAIFAKPYNLTSSTLIQTLETVLGSEESSKPPMTILTLEVIQRDFPDLWEGYLRLVPLYERSDTSGSLPRSSTNIGSHLTPLSSCKA